MDILRQFFIAGQQTPSSAADNATATATVSITAGQTGAQARTVVLGVSAYYSAAVAAVKNITLSYTFRGTAIALTVPWDYTNGAAYLPFPSAITTDAGTTVTATLPASGTGGITGVVTIWHMQV